METQYFGGKQRYFVRSKGKNRTSDHKKHNKDS